MKKTIFTDKTKLSLSVLAHGRLLLTAVSAMVVALSGSLAHAVVISNVVETGGDNDPTDTITAKWTGQSFTVSVANEPLIGSVVGETYTVGAFGSDVPAMVDRAHRYLDDPGTGGSAQPIPAYLLGGDYILSGNDNRDNASYTLDVTLSGPARAYMLIDNRLGDATGSNPPTFSPANMQWILDDAWTATSNGLNRLGDLGAPDEVPIDESADGTINQYYSVYFKDYGVGTFTLRQADNTGQNMYGVVVQAIPEPTMLASTALAMAAFAFRRRR